MLGARHLREAAEYRAFVVTMNDQVTTTLLVAIFAAGYALIVAESWTRVNKAAPALLAGVLAWAVLLVRAVDRADATERLVRHTGEIAGLLFFVLGAMTIVEVIDAHGGFERLMRPIRQRSKRRLLVVLALLTFVLSAILDNLTTTIVAVSLLRRLTDDRRDRMRYAGVVVIAANAGGAWSPIGDVTTTMLWIGGQITSSGIVRSVLLPSLTCLLATLLIAVWQFRGPVAEPEATAEPSGMPGRHEQTTVLAIGLAVLAFVPVVKALTGLPPCMGMLLGLGLLWAVTEHLHRAKEPSVRKPFSVAGALNRIDSPVILFFLGILLCVAALQSAGLLDETGTWLARHLRDARLIALVTGLASAVVDNVPLVAALQNMYGPDRFPCDHPFWSWVAYSVGTGGSILAVGSAAGVAAMGMEQLDFWWYLRRIGWIALAGYMAGAVVCLAI